MFKNGNGVTVKHECWLNKNYNKKFLKDWGTGRRTCKWIICYPSIIGKQLILHKIGKKDSRKQYAKCLGNVHKKNKAKD